MLQESLFDLDTPKAPEPPKQIEIADIWDFRPHTPIAIRLGSIEEWIKCSYSKQIISVPSLEEADRIAKEKATIVIVTSEKTSMKQGFRDILAQLPKTHPYYLQVQTMSI